MTVADLPRAYARTRAFRLGRPSDFTIAPDGARVLFLRAVGAEDPMTCLWELDVATGAERLVVDPRALPDTTATKLSTTKLSDAERALRERMRQRATGIVDYTTDRDVRRAAFSLDGAIWVVELAGGDPVRLDTATPAMLARLDPTGCRVAYVFDGTLRVVDIPEGVSEDISEDIDVATDPGGTGGTEGPGSTSDGGTHGDGTDRAIATPEHPDVTYGLAEHVAAESMYRYDGSWWSPDGTRLAVARVDTTRVRRWYLADPANPDAPPTPVAYPSAGTPNADVSLWIYDPDKPDPTEVRWDRDAYEYLVTVAWSSHALHLVVQSRDQRTVRVLAADPGTGETTLLREERDDAWVEVVQGVPAVTNDGALVWIAASADTWRLVVDGEAVTPPGLHVTKVSDVDDDVVLFVASTEPTEQHLWTWTATGGARQFTQVPGVHAWRRAGGTTVVAARSLDFAGQRTTVYQGSGHTAEIASHAAVPPVDIRPTMCRLGERELRSAVLLPAGHTPGQRLPVLLDPYGGPHGQEVLKARTMFAVSQWFADQGFAVLVTDGRGTPGRGLAWEHSVRGDKLTLPLQDQVDALHAAARDNPDLDLGRVAIRGGSYGGYLAAAAVLRRPDVFHAAVAIAPVTDPTMYDTHWQERYLGHPDTEPENYARCSLIPDAPTLSRPLLLVHGLADDNVVVAHTLRLSRALLATGRDHRVMPLTGATHMSPSDESGVNLLLLERDFLLGALDPPVADVSLGR
jgi:dipeptidyl-peptidase-4